MVSKSIGVVDGDCDGKYFYKQNLTINVLQYISLHDHTNWTLPPPTYINKCFISFNLSGYHYTV